MFIVVEISKWGINSQSVLFNTKEDAIKDAFGIYNLSSIVDTDEAMQDQVYGSLCRKLCFSDISNDWGVFIIECPIES